MPSGGEGPGKCEVSCQRGSLSQDITREAGLIQVTCLTVKTAGISCRGNQLFLSSLILLGCCF